MRGEYNTRQKREMLAFLRRHDLESYSVDDLVAGTARARPLAEPRRTAIWNRWPSRARCASIRTCAV